MIIQHNNQTYRINFQYCNGHKHGKAALHNITHKKVATNCTIEVKIAEKEWKPLATGKSVRDRLDQFKKSVGRRKALQNATKTLGDKDLQKEIWRQYFLSHSDVVSDNLANIKF